MERRINAQNSISLQGLGDTKTPLVSSLIELAGKIVITYTLVAPLGYFGIIIAEPIVWSLMVVPLMIRWSVWDRTGKNTETGE